MDGGVPSGELTTVIPAPLLSQSDVVKCGTLPHPPAERSKLHAGMGRMIALLDPPAATEWTVRGLPEVTRLSIFFEATD